MSARPTSNRGQLRSSQIFQQTLSSQPGHSANPTSSNPPHATSSPATTSFPSLPTPAGAQPTRASTTNGTGSSSTSGPLAGSQPTQTQPPSGAWGARSSGGGRKMGSIGSTNGGETSEGKSQATATGVGRGGNVGRSNVPAQSGHQGGVGQTHPLKEDWTYYYVHRPPGAKVIEYEKEIRKVASFGSTESFWSVHSHLLKPGQLPPVTDLLLFASKIKRPVWEELPNGGKWTIRLRKGVSDRLWEDVVLALIGDQFDEEEGIVGIVLSVRGQEDILAVWSDRETSGVGEGVSAVKDKLLQLLGLPPATALEYKSNRSLLEGATQKVQHHHSSANNSGNSNNRNQSTFHSAPTQEVNSGGPVRSQRTRP